MWRRCIPATRSCASPAPKRPSGEKFDTLNDAVYDANWRSQFLSGIMQPLMNVIGNLSYVAVCVLGSILALQGIIDIGVIVSFILYVRLFTSPLTQIAQGMTNLQTASASAHRIFDFLASEELPDESGKAAAAPPDAAARSISSTSASATRIPRIRSSSRTSPPTSQPGQKVAIVGPTGAGKTTMVNLLMRFYELNGGSIKIDGVPIDGHAAARTCSACSAWCCRTPGCLRARSAKTWSTTCPASPTRSLRRSAAPAGWTNSSIRCPRASTPCCPRARSISAGQKQLLTIARAMLQNAPMLILDEATSSVDTRTELLIQRAMDQLTENRTSFVIAHRLSTIKNADLILVMKDGDVIESGTHETLMQQGGFYADLYNSQFEQAS